jgi:pyrimidine nucleoside transport protein
VLNDIIKLQVDWHPVFWGLSLQFIFALITLETQWGYDAFQWAGDRVTEFLRYSEVGSSFVFGTVFAEHYFAFGVSTNKTGHHVLRYT